MLWKTNRLENRFAFGEPTADSGRTQSSIEASEEVMVFFHPSLVQYLAESVSRLPEANGVGAALMLPRLRQLVEFVAPVARVFDGRQELEVASVGGGQQLAQRRQ